MHVWLLRIILAAPFAWHTFMIITDDLVHYGHTVDEIVVIEEEHVCKVGEPEKRVSIENSTP